MMVSPKGPSRSYRTCCGRALWTLVGTEKITLIRQKLLATQSMQKKYADKRWMPLTFAMDDRVFIRVSSRKGLQSACKLGKLAPRFVGPFEITEWVGMVAYRLVLPPQF